MMAAYKRFTARMPGLTLSMTDTREPRMYRAPATSPIMMAAHGYTVDVPDVMATRPARAPLPIMPTSYTCLPVQGIALSSAKNSSMGYNMARHARSGRMCQTWP